jgi:hypothetical protein
MLVIIIPLTKIKIILRKCENEVYTFTMNTITFLMTGIATTGMKFDSKKQFKFYVFQYIVTDLTKSLPCNGSINTSRYALATVEECHRY